MKKIIIVSSILVVLLFTMILTNPSKNDFSLWLKDNAIEESEDMLTKGIIELFGEKSIELATNHSNYIIFSKFETDLSELGLEKMTFIGVFNFYIPI